MEGIIPLLLIVGALVLTGALRKKGASATEPQEYKPEPSPWDELLKELNQANQQPETATPELINSDESTASESEWYDSSKPYSYEDELVDEAAGSQENLLIEPESLQSPFTPASLSVAVSEVAVPVTVSEAVPVAEVSAPKKRESDIFNGGFDLGQAVIYAEILKPKYLEY